MVTIYNNTQININNKPPLIRVVFNFKWIKIEDDSFKNSIAIKNSDSILTYLKIEREILSTEVYNKLLLKLEELRKLLPPFDKSEVYIYLTHLCKLIIVT